MNCVACLMPDKPYECEGCGEEFCWDCIKSFPRADQPEECDMYCEECANAWDEWDWPGSLFQ